MDDTKTPNQVSDQAFQPRCMDMPSDAAERHYWSWVQAPQSIPNQYRECMTCKRIDATEWLAQRDAQHKKAYEGIFKWLLGEAGDFPKSIPGKRYGFRTELRQRLLALTNKQDGELQLNEVLSDVEALIGGDFYDFDTQQAAKKLIKHYANTKALQARIDELDKKLPRTLDYNVMPTQAKNVVRRLDELQTELNKLKGSE